MFDKKTDTQPLTETKELARETTTSELSAQRNIGEITTEIILQKGQIVHSFIEIGRLLIEAKEQLAKGHGHWLKWLSTSVDISERMAQRYMQLAEEYANTTSVTDLGMTKALALLALPGNEREPFITESHEVDGKQKHVSEMSTREVKNAIREKKEATAKSEDGSFKPIWKDDVRKKPETSSVSSDSLNNLAHEFESAQNHLDSILDIVAKQAKNPAILNKYADELRSRHEKTLKCMTIAKLEVS